VTAWHVTAKNDDLEILHKLWEWAKKYKYKRS